MAKKNLANMITCVRIISTFVMIFTDDIGAAFYTAYIIAGLSDVLDGFVARKLKITSEIGRKLDSIADLFFFTTMMIKIWPHLVKYLPKLIWAIIWITVAIRVFIYTVIGFIKKKFISTHNVLNKATGALMFLLPFLIFSKQVFNIYGSILAVFALVAALYELLLATKKPC